MTRPLMNKSFVDLELMAERNWDNRAELDLIRSELVHRTTNAAKTLRHRVETWIKDCDKAAAIKAAKPEAANRRQSRFKCGQYVRLIAFCC